ncbi:unnamed protein product [Orchesella dallaii]|uniref:Uncharacterized protein n=1 Tax=Orchesella dallaii TaxID=48710 RepID=A0ABP1S8F6_9HEXA
MFFIIPVLHFTAFFFNFNFKEQVQFPRNLVSVWLDSPYFNRRYQQSRVEGMIRLISGTFGSIAMDNVPIMERFASTESLRSTASIPIKAAEHNNKSAPGQRMKVMVSFDLSPSSQMESHPTFFNSFLVAKHYADQANTIFPGTVDTLLLHHDDYLRVQAEGRHGHVNIPAELHTAWSELNQRGNKKYNLAVTISLDLCGVTEESGRNLSEIRSQFVKYADIVVPVIYVGSDRLFTPCEEHSWQLELIRNCEANLKELKATVETIPIVICRTRLEISGTTTFGQCWQLMSDWAIKNKRKVIMYEAFDNLNGDYVGGNGWWRLTSQFTTGLENSAFEKKRQGEKVMCATSTGVHPNATEFHTSTPEPNVRDFFEDTRNYSNSQDITEEIGTNGSNTGFIVIAISLIFFLVLVSVSAVWFYAKHKRNKTQVSYYSRNRYGDDEVLF